MLANVKKLIVIKKFCFETIKLSHIKTTANFKALGLDHEVKLKLDPVVYFAGFAVKF